MTQFTIKLGSFLTDLAEYPPNKNPVTFHKDMVTWKKRSYSFDGFMPGSEYSDTRKLLLDSITQLNFLGFNSSLMLYGLTDLQSQEDAINDVFSSVFNCFNNDKTHGVLQLSVDIEMECYEVFADNQVRDLLSSDGFDQPKIRESDSGVYVELLTKHNCSSAASCSSKIKEALRRQTVLVSLPIPNLSIVPNSLEEKLYAPRVVGSAAHIFVILKIKQFIYVRASESIVQLESTLQIVSFASSDHLGIHASPTEAIAFMTHQQFHDIYSLSSSKITAKIRDMKIAHFTSQEVKKNLQQNSFKALSTLTRVVNLLGAKYEAFESKSSPAESPVSKRSKSRSGRPAVSESKGSHIPFRDSLLTRLLQSSLQGNYAQFFITRINSADTSPETSLSAMRFASGLFKLFNIISNNKKQISFATFENYLEKKSTLITFKSNVLSADILTKLKTSDEDAIQSLNSLIITKFGDTKNFVVKSFSDFERAILDVRNDLKEISDFCEEMDTYFANKQESLDVKDMKARGSILPLLGDAKGDDVGGGSKTAAKRRPMSVFTNRRASYDDPPTLTKLASNIHNNYSIRRLTSFEVQIQPASSSEVIDEGLITRLAPPQHRTSLPELASYLVRNGASNFHDTTLPDIVRKRSIDKGSKHTRKLKSVSVDHSSAQDEQLVVTNNLQASHKMSRQFSFANNQNSNEGEGEIYLSETEKAFFGNVSRGAVDGVDDGLRAGVNIHVKNSFGRDAMQIACRNGNLELLSRLNEMGGNVHTIGPDGENLFHIASSYGHIGIMMWLLEQGLNVSSVNSKGQTAAHIAARRGELQVLKFLHFMCYMDFCCQDNEGKTPLQTIPRYGPENIPEMKSFINMITATPETKELHVFTLERENAGLKRYLAKAGLIHPNTGQLLSLIPSSRSLYSTI